MTMGATPLTVELEKDGALLRLRLSRPKANIVDAQDRLSVSRQPPM